MKYMQGEMLDKLCWIFSKRCFCQKINPYAASGHFGHYKIMQKSWKMIETLAHGYSSESTQQELSNEQLHDRVQMILKNHCILVLLMKVASALEGSTFTFSGPFWALLTLISKTCYMSLGLTNVFIIICLNLTPKAA